VLRPGGEIILLSRVSAEAGMRYFIEQGVAPLAHRLGWRTDFAWAVFANGPNVRTACNWSNAVRLRRSVISR